MNGLEDTNIEELMFHFFYNHCTVKKGCNLLDSTLYAAFLSWLNDLTLTCEEETKQEIALTSFTPERFRKMLIERGYRFSVNGSCFTGLIYTWSNIAFKEVMHDTGI